MVQMSSLLALDCRRFLIAMSYRYAVVDLLYDYLYCYSPNCYYCLSLCCYYLVRSSYSPIHSKGMMGLLTSVFKEKRSDNIKLDNALIFPNA